MTEIVPGKWPKREIKMKPRKVFKGKCKKLRKKRQRKSSNGWGNLRTEFFGKLGGRR